MVVALGRPVSRLRTFLQLRVFSPQLDTVGTWETQLPISSLGSPQRLSTTSHRTSSDINLELVQRKSSSPHRDSARAIPRRFFLVALRDAPTTLGPHQLVACGPCLRQHVLLLRNRRGRQNLVPRSVNRLSEFLNIAHHFDNGEILRPFWGWHGATAIPGSCRFALMLSLIRRTQIWPSLRSGVGLIHNGSRRSGQRCEGHMQEKGTQAPVVLMPWR